LNNFEINKIIIRENTNWNFSYYPIILKSESFLLKVKERLNDQNIFPRRYFYPSLDSLTFVNSNQYCPISRDISSRVLCLPLFDELKYEKIAEICKIINLTK
jgi:dTDP-4-amino-4,6-dideoxygalactose transaminase